MLRAALLSVLILTSLSCRRPATVEDLKPVREQLQLASREGAESYAPEALAVAQVAYREAELELRRHTSRLDPRTYSTQRWEAVRRAREAAVVATSLAEENALSAQKELGSLLTEVQAALRLARERGAPRRVRRSLKLAELAASRSRQLEARGWISRALEEARNARGLADEARAQLDRRILRLRDQEQLALWQSWVREAIADSRRGGPAVLVVDKGARKATLLHKGRAERRFSVELGFNALDRKLLAGDGATPEGRYRVIQKKQGRETAHYKALLLDYPNREDRRRFREAQRRGEIPSDAAPGSLIEIHGDGGKGRDWTDGCVALTNGGMDYVYRRLSVGSPVIIVGVLDDSPVLEARGKQ